MTTLYTEKRHMDPLRRNMGRSWQWAYYRNDVFRWTWKPLKTVLRGRRFGRSGLR